MANKSVEAFRRLTVDLMRNVLNDSVAELNAQADSLVATMKAVCPVGPTGNLKASIRKAPGKKVTTVIVMAGGALTTTIFRRTAKGGGRGISYDYSRAVEFGTSHEPAHPFFFPTYRLKRNPMRSAMKRKITKRIKQYSAE
jgi:HK97 gp10 family phage protein